MRHYVAADRNIESFPRLHKLLAKGFAHVLGQKAWPIPRIPGLFRRGLCSCFVPPRCVPVPGPVDVDVDVDVDLDIGIGIGCTLAGTEQRANTKHNIKQ